MSDEELMGGHPAQGNPEPFKGSNTEPKKEEKRKVYNVAGRELELDDEVAGALASYQQQVNQQMEQLNQKNNELYSYLTKQQVEKPREEKASMDDEELLYSNPREFKEKLRREIMEEIGDIRGQVLNEVNTQAHSQKLYSDFWTTFWRENPDLDKDKDSFIADSVFSKHKQNWANSGLTIDQAQDNLAKETRKIIANYVNRQSDASQEKGTFSEGPSSPRSQVKSESDIPIYKSASELLRARRKKKFQL